MLKAPNTVIWEVTNRCNLRCKHCYVEASENGKELNTEDAKKVIDQLSEAGVFMLSFTGGEPLVRKDIFELISYANETGLYTNLATNATLIDEKTAKRLKGTVSYVQVSIDGPEDVHDSIRGTGNFKKMMKGVQNLKKYDIPIGFTFVLMRENSKYLYETAEIAKDLGGSELRVFRLLNEGRGKDLNGITPGEYREIMEKVSSWDHGIKITIDEAFKFLTFRETKRKREIGCNAGKSICGIKPEGHVLPCPMLNFREFYCGKLPEENFETLWKNSAILNMIRNIDEIKGKCGNCKFLQFCGGGCRAAAYSEFKDIYASDPGCWVGL